MSVLSRMRNLFEGVLGQWLTRREHRNPGAVYEAAIQARVRQYGKLRDAAAGVIYMRGKLTDDLRHRRAELTAVSRELESAVERDDDDLALALISRRNHLHAEVERLAHEVEEVSKEAEVAKQNLVTFQQDIDRLKEEKVRMIAKWANAHARQRFQRTLEGISPDADIRALDEVREHIRRLAGELEVERELGDEGLDGRLDAVRRSQAVAAARAELDELKQTRRRRLLPMSLAAGAPAAH